MKVDYITLFYNLCNDVGVDPYTIKYCTNRLKSEGIQFLTVTLPTLSKAVLRSLELGYFDRPTSFAWKRKSLRYFAKFLNKIFDPNTGLVLTNPCALSILQLRQVCDYSYKLAVPYSQESLDRYTDAFIATDNDVPSLDYDFAWVDQLRKDWETYFRKISKSTVDEILHSATVRSGPGTYSRSTPNAGYDWYVRKSADYGVHEKLRHLAWASRPLRSAPMPRIVDYDLYSELLFVPKDSRGPRTIVREPYHTLRYQMAYNSYLTHSLERHTKFRINFKNQQVNRSLAELSSRTRDYATLDLKDASDRVSFNIVKHIFRNSPGLKYFLLNSRTNKVKLPNGDTKQLNKLSGMGSGFTFPTMSLLIYLSVVRGVSNRHGIPYREAMKAIYVYGDDLIVPVRFYHTAIKSLERSALMVNDTKSFYRSHFRESCGGDYFNGQDVTPCRLKLSGCTISVSGKLSVTGDLAYLQVERHCRELVKAGLLRTANYFYSVLEAHLGPLPYISGESPVIGRWTFHSPDYPMDSTGAYKKVRCIIPTAKVKKVGDLCDPYLHLASSIASAGRDSGVGQTYGEVSVPRTIRYRRSRVSAFRLMG